MKQKTRSPKPNEEKGPLKMDVNDNTANRDEEEKIIFSDYCKLGNG